MTNFGLKKHHGYSMIEIEGMVPWERLLHVDQIKAQIRQEREALREELARAKRGN